MFRLRSILQDIAIFLSVLMSLMSVAGIYLRHWRPFQAESFYNYVAPYGLMAHRLLAFTVGVLGLLVSVNLYRRVRSAWVLGMIGQSMLFALHLYYTGTVFSLFSLVSLFILLVLGVTAKDFRRVPKRRETWQALGLSLIPFGLALFNAILSLTFLRRDYAGTANFWLALKHSVRFLVLMDTQDAYFVSHMNFLYTVTLIAMSWISLIIAFILLLKPLVINPIVNGRERARVLSLVHEYGQNPMAYLALSKDKQYFFGEMTDGVIAYMVVNNVLVVCGDLICQEENAIVFMGEITRFAHKNGWKLLFLDITEKLRHVYEEFGFGLVKIGEDACIELANYDLKGKKAAKVRANINHARRLGIEVAEYQPLVHRDVAIEQAFQHISHEWFKQKGAELGFMLGDLALENPHNRRYFYAKDATGKPIALVVFVPYEKGQAYMADVTRRLSDAPNGTMEVIMFDAFTKMREDGVLWGNLGLCPLANIEGGQDNSMTTQLMQFIYENMNGVYGFKGLYQAKKKFAPTDWQERFIAYTPKPFGFSYAYAIIKAQNPKGINKLLLEKLRLKTGNRF
ncbi:bifunctional lysylphosphatidylglycerol flippase/synthetase MprF [Lactococcus kimchii]|uniref:bifunctional lysylphosphatidylglycerol flippase/synthetase MprF n=1 Tax=Lactococcus sp. S-13 TaxID=2507158 RepID=UPI001022BAB1|nr:phosphatidylglycerol lysyltransferase domain-containing protein [Lactococcus sp. S-13]RZI49036.1 DUF2156 domain-containing protein [Lactococcus sp. S-13]